MPELNHFFNDGFGWICRQCERDLKTSETDNSHARFYREGEAEAKNPTLSNLALAKWADATQRTLVCPRCGITELADKA